MTNAAIIKESMEYSRIQVEPVAGALGAEITGIDLANDLDDGTIAEIRAAWLENLVVFFRDQNITPTQHIAFAKRFGDIAEDPVNDGLDEFPEIVPVMKLEHETTNIGDIWHSDTAYVETPPMGAILCARELPPVGGDTLFANMYAAYDALSDGMKEMLSGLIAVNSSAKPDVIRTRKARVKNKKPQEAELVSEHPVVRTHPETGRKILYVNSGHTLRFCGMTDEESAPILNYLFQHQVKAEFTCRFHWQPGSIAFWDNRATQHNAINDYHGYKRVLHRIPLAGD